MHEVVSASRVTVANNNPSTPSTHDKSAWQTKQQWPGSQQPPWSAYNGLCSTCLLLPASTMSATLGHLHPPTLLTTLLSHAVGGRKPRGTATVHEDMLDKQLRLSEAGSSGGSLDRPVLHRHSRRQCLLEAVLAFGTSCHHCQASKMGLKMSLAVCSYNHFLQPPQC